jgi:hypothetical protein
MAQGVDLRRDRSLLRIRDTPDQVSSPARKARHLEIAVQLFGSAAEIVQSQASLALAIDASAIVGHL